MSGKKIRFQLQAIINLLGDQLYTKSNVFVRENVQNAIDAIRLLPLDNRTDEAKVVVAIDKELSQITVEDWGIGMSESDMENYYWTIGGSFKKNNAQAQECGVIGKFGVGAFANFGVCDSIEVHTWRKGYNKLSSHILKSDLENGIDDYCISHQSDINHYGTKIIGNITKGRINAVDEVKKYLGEHIQYISEKVFFNNTLLSGQEFPSLSTRNFRSLFVDVVNFKHKQKNIAINISWFYNEDNGQLLLQTSTATKDYLFDGWLSPETGGVLNIYVNKFLLTPTFRAWGALGFKGVLNTNFAEPNVAREGLSKESTESFDNFMIALSLVTSKVISNQGLLNKFPLIENHIIYKVRYDYSEYTEFVSKISLDIYGKKETMTVQEVEAINIEKGIKLYYSQQEELPVTIRSLAVKQDVLVIITTRMSADKRTLVKKYLEKTKAKEISSFELEAVPVDETLLSQEDKAVRAGIHDALYSIHYLNDFEVILCKADSSYNIVLEHRSDKVKVIANVTSPLFKELTTQTQQPHFKFIINNSLITRYLSESLKEFIPTDISQMNREISERTILEFVTDINLIQGSNWRGPTANCINISSTVFKYMEGYYIKIPDRITELVKPILTSADAPVLTWNSDCLFANIISGAHLLTLRIEMISLLTNINGEYRGNAFNNRKVEIFDTGAYLPIPVPPLQDILPFNTAVELQFTHRVDLNRNNVPLSKEQSRSAVN